MSEDENEPKPIEGYCLTDEPPANGEWPAWTWEFFDPDNFDPDDCTLSIRNSHKYWLYDKWRAAIDEYDGPATVDLIDGYRPQGLVAPIDVQEIGGLIIEINGTNHAFRLYRDETAIFIEMSDGSKVFTFDPVSIPTSVHDRIYDTDGVPNAIIDVFETLDLIGPWEEACEDGLHEPEFVNEGSPHEFLRCKQCELSRSTLTWMDLF